MMQNCLRNRKKIYKGKGKQCERMKNIFNQFIIVIINGKINYEELKELR